MMDAIEMEKPRALPYRKIYGIIAIVVVLRFLVHSLFLPVWEGPDEPFHLGRAMTLLSYESAGDDLPPEVVASVRQHPCGEALQNAFGCPPHLGKSAFNIIGQHENREAQGTPVRNYESHQPPLYYLIASVVIPRGQPVETQLLVLRLLSVLFVAIALFGPLRSVLREADPALTTSIALLLLLPGAAEALARASNDAALFLWSAVVWASIRRGTRAGWLALLFAIGPLLKLTAFAVVAAGVVALYQSRGRRSSITAALGSLAVFPVQMLRGWAWGGTYEMNVPLAALPTAPSELIPGVIRSVYVFVKTIFWLGGWSFFRAPLVLVTIWFLLLLLLLLSGRIRSDVAHATGLVVAHATGLVVAAAGFFMLVIQNRRLFGDWGGLGGWYFWNWYPWLAVAAADTFQVRGRARSLLPAAIALFVIISNAAWLLAALRLY